MVLVCISLMTNGGDHLFISLLAISKSSLEKCLFRSCAHFLNLFIYLFIYLRLCWVFVAAHGLFSGCGERGLLFVAVCGPLIAVASRCGAQALGRRASVVVARGLSSCGSQALEHRLSSCGARA